ncbi:uncharacterized protein LOC112466775 [Temnothorax curvispinosus]|uniref:Uncharacterized protein LOC112466775 n=1 Tax=Temnothorax curvispinosus TaxID=300111 RepID=A0A6J1R733_9HYME|nr:uncharacterized protein LOC112466775 [Temnothorax curvispinosus]
MTENDDCTNYEYLNESDTCTDVPNESLSNLEESFSILDILSKNTLVTERPTTPNVSTFKEIAIPRLSTPEKPTTHNTSTPNRFSLKRKFSLVEEQLGNAVDVFKSYVTKKNTVHVEDESLKYFCDSLYGDLKILNKKDLISCKIDIMQV